MRSSEKLRIGVTAPGTRLAESLAERTVAETRRLYGERVELQIHPQCFLSHGHFAGTDEARVDALVETANDPAIDAVWFARGGYGTCRIAEEAIARMGPAARDKAWLGYSDIGFLLGGLHRAGFRDLAHGPMPVDLAKEGGEQAFARGLAWLVKRDPAALEPGLSETPAMAFNLTILSQLLGTPLEPDFTDRELLIEDVGEYMYRIDRYMFHVTSNASVRRCAGIRLGRCSAVPKNDPDFGEDEVAVVKRWCERAGVAYLGRADIGHDVGNRVVPFG